MRKIEKLTALNDEQRKKIYALAKQFAKKEHIYFKLDANILEDEQNKLVSHFLLMKNDRLQSYMLASSYSGNELEITLLGGTESNISDFFQLAISEARERSLNKVMFITDSNDTLTVTNFKNNLLEYDFSEYRLVLNPEKKPSVISSSVTLRQANITDEKQINALDFDGFGEVTQIREIDLQNILLAEVNGEIVGKIWLGESADSLGLFGFVVSAAERGKGYGRNMLAQIINDKLATGLKNIYLEVALINPSALKLYEECGFEKEATFDYYKLNVEQ
ncbi:GNAT family N-acetyltransferase [Vagococcus sp. BWB3-3]|uniref:GNAT family N-acetyltransferase n=1 Tax=Vagococcus allomyrinae TaxID=2794353 RepID=A0A940SW30_9ENTE|nr:GNAT family N-acetyltransferase [Vagococcus allomyrinae]